MPDLDNMAKQVKGPWKRAVYAALADSNAPTQPPKLGQTLAYILSRCAASYAGVQLLQSMLPPLVALASLPLAHREQAFKAMRFPTVPEGKHYASSTARKVGILICAGQVSVTEVRSVLAKTFLKFVSEAEFFGCLNSEDLIKLYGSPEGARASLVQAQGEVASYIDGTAQVFAKSLFERLESVEKPTLPKQGTAEQMEQAVSVNLDLKDEDDS